MERASSSDEDEMVIVSSAFFSEGVRPVLSLSGLSLLGMMTKLDGSTMRQKSVLVSSNRSVWQQILPSGRQLERFSFPPPPYIPPDSETTATKRTGHSVCGVESDPMSARVLACGMEFMLVSLRFLP